MGPPQGRDCPPAMPQCHLYRIYKAALSGPLPPLSQGLVRLGGRAQGVGLTQGRNCVKSLRRCLHATCPGVARPQWPRKAQHGCQTWRAGPGGCRGNATLVMPKFTCDLGHSHRSHRVLSDLEGGARGVRAPGCGGCAQLQEPQPLAQRVAPSKAYRSYRVL